MNLPKIMGILNITPDSFFDGGRYSSLQAAIAQGKKLRDQGADLLDIGGESSRPGALEVSTEEEIERVVPVIAALTSTVSIPLSIDTQKPAVAQVALAHGATWINDIQGLADPTMQEIACSAKATVCVMHMQGAPQTMQKNPEYPEGVVAALLRWFEERVRQLISRGISEKKIVLDPGIGFGKTVAHNLEILHNLPRFKALGFPLLVGISRKSFMSKILDKPVSELLPATLVMNTLALQQGADILRVHDVAEHRDLHNLWMSWKNHDGPPN